MLCPRCSAVFDKNATDGLKKYIPFAKNKGNWPNQRRMTNQNMAHPRPVHQRLGYKTTFVPSNKAPMNQWIHGQKMAPSKVFVERGSSSNARSKSSMEANKYAYKNNYMGKKIL
ncbi:hypothetical protein A2U01_0050755 [Trifolium medium]|uniref:Uncharacterized protein n=1 Tax=Trifolium medium TaxID=97028 RepID=A0A392R157_9FABA|nr:hypothetical protein [Trifolium medium]